MRTQFLRLRTSHLLNNGIPRGALESRLVLLTYQLPQAAVRAEGMGHSTSVLTLRLI